VVSDAGGLRLGFGGAVLVMYILGVVVCLGLLRTLGRDVARRQAVVEGRVVTQ